MNILYITLFHDYAHFPGNHVSTLKTLDSNLPMVISPQGFVMLLICFNWQM